MILESRMEDALTAADWYRNTFKDYYIEIQRHPIPELEQANKGLLDISHKLNIPVVATSDIHYVLKEDAKIHECIQKRLSRRLVFLENGLITQLPKTRKTVFISQEQRW